ncbi:hypothetical protein BH10PSE19_BH10PSE19_08100 [soil metagenome]
MKTLFIFVIFFLAFALPVYANELVSFELNNQTSKTLTIRPDVHQQFGSNFITPFPAEIAAGQKVTATYHAVIDEDYDEPYQDFTHIWVTDKATNKDICWFHASPDIASPSNYVRVTAKKLTPYPYSYRCAVSTGEDSRERCNTGGTCHFIVK